MTRETDYLIQSLFERESLDEMTLDEMKGMAEQYPFSSIIQFLYTCKLKSLYHLDFPESVSKTSLYFNNPYWLNHQLSEDAEKGHFRLSTYETYTIDEDENDSQTVIETGEDEFEANHLENTVEIDEKLEKELESFEDKEEIISWVNPINEPELQPANDNSFSIPIEPYHTIDYFASQGIDLNKETQKDELSTKVKSFTAWLKTMKRLQPTIDNSAEKEPETEHEGAESTVIEASNEVITETMAEVYLKQGMKEKAISIYKKLSLQNPANSHIFADKILQIKENKI